MLVVWIGGGGEEMVRGRAAEEKLVGDRVAEAGLPPAIGGSPVANPGGGGVERDGEWVCFFGAAGGLLLKLSTVGVRSRSAARCQGAVAGQVA